MFFFFRIKAIINVDLMFNTLGCLVHKRYMAINLSVTLRAAFSVGPGNVSDVG